MFEEIDTSLTKIISNLGNALIFARDNGLDPTVDYILLELHREREYKQYSSHIDIFGTLDLYIEEKQRKVSDDQIKDYKSLKKHLTGFRDFSSQPVTFRNLNLRFYNEFMDYLYYTAKKPNGSVGLLTNSAGKIIRLLKGFVNYHVAKGAIPAVDLRNFKVVEEETDAIYLSEEELSDIYRLDLSDDIELDRIRDIFIVGCYTGLRYSDLSTLSSKHIDMANGNINIKQKKVHKAVIIPMIDYVPEILKKYDVLF